MLWIFGAFEDHAPDDPDMFHYSRTYEDRVGVVIMNLRDHAVTTPQHITPVVLSNYPAPHAPGELRPFEVRLY